MVEITYLAIIGIALAAMFFGYGFGLFEGRSQGYKKRRKEEAIEKENKPAPEPITVKVDDPGILRITNEGGYLALDLDGTRVDTAALTAEQRKRLIEMLTLMRPWLEGRPITAPVPPPTAPAPQAASLSSSVTPPPSASPAAPPPAPRRSVRCAPRIRAHTSGPIHGRATCESGPRCPRRWS